MTAPSFINATINGGQRVALIPRRSADGYRISVLSSNGEIFAIEIGRADMRHLVDRLIHVTAETLAPGSLI